MIPRIMLLTPTLNTPATVPRGDRGPPGTSGTLSVDVVDGENGWLPFQKNIV
jgi:hypothetical protein